jgi:cytochrome c oxidase subunit II
LLSFPPTAALLAPNAGASPNASAIDSLYWIVLVVALVVFVLVEGALVFALLRFRARRGAVPAQIRGNTRLQLSVAGAAAVVLLALFVVTLVKLPSIEDPPSSGPGGAALAAAPGVLYASDSRRLPPSGKSLRITVVGRQFLWQYFYPGASLLDGLGAPYSYEELVVPTETTVTLDVVSEDVIHSWWVPALGGKVDAVPGYHGYTWFKIASPGRYRGQCAVMCGRGHARMIAVVHAVTPAEFDAWLAGRRRLLEEANAAAKAEREVLNSHSGPGRVENP